MQIIPTREYLHIIDTNKQYIEDIYKICVASGENVEGNCFYEHGNLNNKFEQLIPKQANLFSHGRYCNNIMEIGFNAGHSVLLFLLANPSSRITIFDICEHRYTVPCFNYLCEKFPNRLMMFAGDSTVTVPAFNKQHPLTKFDLSHIDGCHDKKIANKDFFNALKTSSNYIIFDDTSIEHLNDLFNTYLELDIIKEVFLNKTFIYEHRIGQIV